MARETVKLVSAEGFEFIVDYKAACVSNTIKNMLSSEGALSCCAVSELVTGNLCSAANLWHPGSFTETELREVKFPEITTPILEIVCQYFYYKLRYQHA